MSQHYFKRLEQSPLGASLNLELFIAELGWNAQGLVPVITQQYDTGQVLMMAWMNAEALALTLHEGWVTYWSRSRHQLWKKGEASGNRQRLVELRADCDGDTLLCLADQLGPACHTGRDSCFYFSLLPEQSQVIVNAGYPSPR